MSFLDKIKDKLTPEQSSVPIATSASGGIGNRRGAMGFEDDVCTLSYFGVSCLCCALPELSAVLHFRTLSNLRYVTMFVALPFPHVVRVRRLSYFLTVYSSFMGIMALGLSRFLPGSSGF
jgi:hypothetical protein